MTMDNFCLYLQNRLIQTSQTGGQWYSDTSPTLVFPGLKHRLPMKRGGGWHSQNISGKPFYSPSPKLTHILNRYWRWVKAVGLEDIKQIFLIHYIVYCFNFSTGNQCLRHCIQILALLNLPSFI
jgi:hypothetical protein